MHVISKSPRLHLLPRMTSSAILPGKTYEGFHETHRREQFAYHLILHHAMKLTHMHLTLRWPTLSFIIALCNETDINDNENEAA